MSADGTAGGQQIASGGQKPMLASQRDKAEAKDDAAQKSRMARFNGYFPLGYKAAVSQWWNMVTPAMAEHNVLSYIPYLQKPPTHTQTGSDPVSASNSNDKLNDDAMRASHPINTTPGSDPYGPRSWHSNMVPLSGKNRAINEFSVSRTNEEVQENLVMLHGYGAGLGFFYKNFEGLSRVPGWKVYALDMLGMGRSTRPPFQIRAKDAPGKIAEAESWFVDSLEEWRVARGIERFTLLGHSMGGYMAVAYALKYPGRLKKLILASPVGIPEDPYAVKAEMPSEEPEESTLANEFLQDQDETSTRVSASTDNNNFLNAKKKKDAATAAGTDAPKRPIPKWVSYLWDANISPFSIVRWTGPLGPRFVSGWTSRRFSHLPEAEAQALHEYAYSLFSMKGSGEYALAYILAPGAFARSPLIRRIQGVGRQPLVSSTGSTGAAQAGGSQSCKTHAVTNTNKNTVSTTPTLATTTPSTTGPSPTQTKETGYPVILLYGEHDWMDINGGYAAKEKLDAARAQALAGNGVGSTSTAAEREAENGSAKVIVTKGAGHHVFLDGAEEFNEVIRGEMRETGEWSRRAGRSA